MTSHQNLDTSPMRMDVSKISQTSSLNMFPMTISIGVPTFLLSSMTVRSSLQSWVRKWKVTCDECRIFQPIYTMLLAVRLYFHKKSNHTSIRCTLVPVTNLGIPPLPPCKMVFLIPSTPTIKLSSIMFSVSLLLQILTCVVSLCWDVCCHSRWFESCKD